MNGFWTKRSHAVTVLVVVILLLAGSLAAAAEGVVSSKVDVTIWGRVKFDTQYDTGNLGGLTDFATYLTTEKDGEMNFNPRDTRFGFAAVAGEGDWTYRAVFEMDFYGDNACNNLLPRMRLGYTEAKNTDGLSLRAGQDWIPIAQQNPGTVDFGILAWGGNLWWRVPQVVLRQRGQDFELLAGAMKHRISTLQERDESLPWFVGRVALYGVLGEKSLLALGGGARSVTVDGQSYDAWLVAGEFRVPLGDKLVLNGEYYTGRGIGREFIHYGLDYNSTHPDGPVAIASQGGFANLAYKAMPGVTFNAGFGVDDPDVEDLAGSASAPYIKNNVGFLNVKKQVTEAYGVGFEVMTFATETMAGDLEGQRYTASTWFIF